MESNFHYNYISFIRDSADLEVLNNNLNTADDGSVFTDESLFESNEKDDIDLVLKEPYQTEFNESYDKHENILNEMLLEFAHDYHQYVFRGSTEEPEEISEWFKNKYHFLSIDFD